MAKRGATSELNHENWDDEDEQEEAGVFVQADKETLQHRVIKRAKRRGTGSEDHQDGAKPAAFGGFGGLTGTATKSKTFGGFSLTPAGGSGFNAFQGSSLTSTPGGTSGLFSGASSSPAQPLNGSKEKTPDGSQPGTQPNKGQGDWKDSPSYFSFLKALNLSVLAWIKQHVEENPYIILTPIFKDYETYLKDQEAEARANFASPAKKDAGPTEDSGKASVETAATSSTKKADSQAKAFTVQADSKEESAAPVSKVSAAATLSAGSGVESSKGFSFGASGANFSLGGTSKAMSSTTPSTLGKSGFSFGSTSTTTSTTSSSGFSFGATTSTTSSSGLFKSTSSAPEKPLFSFGTSSLAPATSGFSFSGLSSQTATTSGGSSQDTNGKNDDDEYVPPKPEVREIKEDDALYSKRCKLYFQRNDQWVDKGVGNLHLKPVGESKTQLLIRADTNLGNILLNVMISASTPVSRQGNNNVLVVCVPNPPLDSKTPESEQDKPVPMLIRVKTAADADELFGKIQDRKELL